MGQHTITLERIRGRKLQKIRQQHMRRNPLCVECMKQGIVKVWDELDHVHALVNGGDDDGPRQGLCRAHHAEKTARDLGHRYREKVVIGPDGWPVDQSLSAQAEERRMPTDLKPSRIPLTIVCGPPGSGKSTYIRQHAGHSDLVIDLDAIQQKLSGLPEHHTGGLWVGPALTERNNQLRSLATDVVHAKAWLIIAAPNPVERARWASMLGANVVTLDVPLDECIRRINADPKRRGHTERMINAATSWWRSQPSVLA